jgi:hypothetical protein
MFFKPPNLFSETFLDSLSLYSATTGLLKELCNTPFSDWECKDMCSVRLSKMILKLFLKLRVKSPESSHSSGYG